MVDPPRRRQPTNRIVVFVLATAALGVGILIVNFMVERRRHAAALREATPSTTSKPELELGGFHLVAGTTVLRAHLVRAKSAGLSSYEYKRDVHNVLYASPTDGKSHWLLKDDDHSITYLEDIPKRRLGSDPPVATIALVKPESSDVDLAPGRLLLADPAGTNIVEISAGVRAVRGATVTKDRGLLVVFERDRKYFVANHDPKTFAPIAEVELIIPTLE